MAPVKAKKSGSSDKGEKSDPKSKTSVNVNKELIIRASAVSDFIQFPNVYITKERLDILELKVNNFVKVTVGLKELVMLVDVADHDDDDILLINQYYLDLHGILIGDRCKISKFTGSLDYASDVNIEIKGDFKFGIDELVKIGIIYKGLNSGDFYIKDINSDITETFNKLTLDEFKDEEDLIGYLVHPKTTKINISKVDCLPPPLKKYKFEDIGGLDKKIEDLLKSVKIPLYKYSMFKSFGIEPPKGILMYGNSGVGKTMLLRSLASELRGIHIIKIDSTSLISKYLGDSEEKLRSYFKEAMKYQPSIILIDEIENLIPNRKNNEDVSDVDNRMINTFNTLMEEMKGKCLLVCASNDINKIDISVRRPGKIDIEIEIGVPDNKGRLDILNKKVQSIEHCDLKEEQILEIAEKTHGYVGSDLLTLVRESVMKAINRSIRSDVIDNVQYSDFLQSMKEIRPSAMKEIILEMPTVKWTDIGGQAELKQKIFEMVELPLKEAHRFKQFGIKVPKGLLLYGPPGCSKTMTAKALATESGLNFIAIKGPEIFDKYVGESERKIRDIFSKARASSPSIIFIDEIDAIAIDRENSESSNVSKQVLNTMLNELDGVEELNGVIIVGATNRPWTIDPALLRPGRLDRHVYVSPPDNEARREIVKNCVKKFGIDQLDLEDILQSVVSRTEGCSGAQVVQICQEAGLQAVSRGSDKVAFEDFAVALKQDLLKLDVSDFDAWKEQQL